MKIPRTGDTKAMMQRILSNHIMSLVRDREKVPVRRNFIAVIRQGGFKVVRPRGLKCCDVVIFEVALGPGDSVDPRIVEKSVHHYINWELKLYFKSKEKTMDIPLLLDVASTLITSTPDNPAHLWGIFVTDHILRRKPLKDRLPADTFVCHYSPLDSKDGLSPADWTKLETRLRKLRMECVI